MAGTELERAGNELGLRMAREIYADRAYDDTGNLVSRKLPGAVLHDPEEAASRVQATVREGAIRDAKIPFDGCRASHESVVKLIISRVVCHQSNRDNQPEQ